MFAFPARAHAQILVFIAIADACYTQLETYGATCVGRGLMPIESKAECQDAVDYVNGVEDERLRPGGPVVEVNYNFRAAGCYTSCVGTHLDKSGHPHYFCGGFNSNNMSMHIHPGLWKIILL